MPRGVAFGCAGVLVPPLRRPAAARVLDGGPGLQRVNPLNGGHGDDDCGGTPEGPSPPARSVVQCDDVTTKVDLGPSGTGPPDGHEPATIGCEPGWPTAAKL